jgi:hypothetical protein
MVVSRPRRGVREENMSSKQKGLGPNKTGTYAKERIVPVAEGSLQSKTPGGGPGPRGNRQSGLGGNLQAGNTRSQGGQYGGAGSQQSGWSARQQAQRMQSRAEQERLGQSQQSGHGGTEQKQAAGNQEATNAGSMQSGGGGAHQSASADKASADMGSRRRPDDELDSTR